MQHRRSTSSARLTNHKFTGLNHQVSSLEGKGAAFRRRKEFCSLIPQHNNAPSWAGSLCLLGFCFFIIYDGSRGADGGRWQICLPWLSEAASHKGVLMGLSPC